MLPYVVIGLTAAASAIGAPMWIALVGATALSMASAIEHRKLAGIADFSFLQVMLFGGWRSIGNALAACGAAYMLGRLALLTAQ